MSNKMDPQMKAKTDEATKVGEDFVRLYYKTLEQRPHRAHLLYIESSVVIWDGNPCVGTSQISKFFEDLPTLNFQVAGMDCQPISSVAVSTQKTFVINTSGVYRVSGDGTRSFSQNFLVTADGGKWKIASDNLRSQITPNQT